MQDLKALVKKRQPLNHASRVDVRCSALKWQLLSAVVREAMVTTAIADLSLTMSRNQDLSGEPFHECLVLSSCCHNSILRMPENIFTIRQAFQNSAYFYTYIGNLNSCGNQPQRMGQSGRALILCTLESFQSLANAGSSKFIIHRIDIFDPTPVASGTDAAASAVEDGSILEVWNPDESWERDPMVRVNAVMGVPTEEHTVYENLDLMVHPMRIHINDALLSNLWVRAMASRTWGLISQRWKSGCFDLLIG